MHDDVDVEPPESPSDVGEIIGAFVEGNTTRIVGTAGETTIVSQRDVAAFEDLGEATAPTVRLPINADALRADRLRAGQEAARLEHELEAPREPRRDRDPQTFEQWQALQEDPGITVVGGSSGGGGGRSKKDKTTYVAGNVPVIDSRPGGLRLHVKGVPHGVIELIKRRPILEPLEVLNACADEIERLSLAGLPSPAEPPLLEPLPDTDLFVWGFTDYRIRLLRNRPGTVRRAIATYYSKHDPKCQPGNGCTKGCSKPCGAHHGCVTNCAVMFIAGVNRSKAENATAKPAS
jgi:hypothetical protein